MKVKFWRTLLLSALCAAPSQAHVGSPDICLSGKAGLYQLLVTVRPPEVIPGIAIVEVQSDDPSLQSLAITPVPLAESEAHFAPAADVLKASDEEPGFYNGSIWIMRPGSWQVRVRASGKRGEGTLSVPVPAMAMRIKGMQRGMGSALFGLMSMLVIGLIAIAGACAGEATLTPGAAMNSALRHKAFLAMALAAVVVLGVLLYGRYWWNQDEAQYGDNVYKPLHFQMTKTAGVLTLQLSDPGWLPLRKPDDLIPDHGHLMHLYAIRQPGLDVVFHLHPEPSGPEQFRLRLPEMPSGTYRLYGDIVHENGFPETLTSSLTIAPGETTGRALQGDDASGIGAPVTHNLLLSSSFRLPDGCRMEWLEAGQSLRARQMNVLHFQVLDEHGKPPDNVGLYMGMLGHAAFVKTDFATFAHIHPDGSANMAAYMMAQQETKAAHAPMTSMDGMPGMSNNGDMAMSSHQQEQSQSGPWPNKVSFPYGFPQPGRYRIFVQMRKGNTVETGLFDAEVR